MVDVGWPNFDTGTNRLGQIDGLVVKATVNAQPGAEQFSWPVDLQII